MPTRRTAPAGKRRKNGVTYELTAKGIAACNAIGEAEQDTAAARVTAELVTKLAERDAEIERLRGALVAIIRAEKFPHGVRASDIAEQALRGVR